MFYRQTVNMLKLNFPQRVVGSAMWHVCWKCMDVSEGCAATSSRKKKRWKQHVPLHSW